MHPARLLTALLVVASLSGERTERAESASSPRGGDVTGTVKLPENQPLKGTKPGQRYPGDTGHDERRQGPAVVFLEPADGAKLSFEAPKEPKTMGQVGRQFTPLALPIVLGTSVEFTNGDDEYHNVFSRSKPKNMELGRWGKGEHKAEKFDKPGIVRLRCAIHGHMHAVIVVLETPYFATTDESGKFKIENVPPGKYKICAFHEDYEPKEKTEDPLHAVGREIEVTEKGASADLDLGKK